MPNDELAVAQRERKLHRNFPSYSTKPACDLLAFGISAIGKVGPAYVQNVRTLDEHYDHLDAQALSVLHGFELTHDDIVHVGAQCSGAQALTDKPSDKGIVFRVIRDPWLFSR